ncbi:hypothetical protein JCM3774_003852 [Rhodotorula dairenensis]
MAKRGAEKQLTQDNVEDDDREQNGDGEFAKASEQALAGRKIRGMPKRAGAKGGAAQPPAATTTSTEPTAAQKTPLFGATAAPNPFAAFGTSSNPPAAPAASAAASPFTFGVPAAPAPAPTQPEATQAAAGTPSFSFAPAGTSTFSFSASQPSAASAAPPTFSFGGSSSFGSSAFGSSAFSSAPAASVPAAAPPAPARTKTERSQSPALTYYTSLRAMNLSLVDALSAAVEKDPFVDLSADGLLDKLRDKYISYRSKVQSEYDATREGGDESSKSKGMEVDKPAAKNAAAFEIPEIFRNPPKPVPIADLSETGDQKQASAPAAAAPKPFAPTVPENEIPAIFRNPPKPVPIADLSGTGEGSAPSPAAAKSSAPPTVDESEIPAIFRNPPKPVPIADLTEEKQDDAKKPPAPPAVFSFAGSTVKATAPASTLAATGGFVFKAEPSTSTEKSSFSFPPAAAPTSSTALGGSASKGPGVETTSSSSEAGSKPASAASNRDELKPPSAPKLAPAKLTNPPAKPSPLRFGQSASPPTSPEKPADEAVAAKPSKGGFSFAAQFGGIAKGDAKPQGAEKSTDETKAPNSSSTSASEPAASAPTPAFSFGTTSTSSPFSFGSASAAPSSNTASGFSFGAATTSTSASSTATTSATTPAAASPFAPAASKPVPFTFGATAPSAGGFGAANATSSGAAGSPPASFGFGAALQGGDGSKPRSAGFGFGSGIGSPGGTSTSMAAPPTTLSEKDQPAKATFGFSFGAATPAATAAPASAVASAADFSFLPSGPTIADREHHATGGDSTAAPSEAATDSRAQTPGANPFTGRGEGEEGEDVLHASRCRVYQLTGIAKPEDSNLGIANVQLKEKDGKIRMLARHDTNGKVLINFSLYSGLTLKREKVFVTFMGFDEAAQPTTYRLRFKTVEGVAEFEEAVADAQKKLQS